MIAADAIPWSNVAMAAVFVFGFVAFVWVVSRHGVEVEFRDPPDRMAPEWRYERTTRRPTEDQQRTQEWEADK